MRQTLRNALDRARQAWRRVPTAIRSGWITAWVTFTGTLLTILTGLLPRLAEAISSGNYTGFFDALGLGWAAAVAAATGFVAGLVNAVYRWLVPISTAYRTPSGEPLGD